MITAKQIMRKILLELPVKVRPYTKQVMETLLEAIIHTLIEEEEGVLIHNLCKFTWEEKLPTSHSLPSGNIVQLPRRKVIKTELSRALKGWKKMEKYAVVQDDSLIKQADSEERNTCPICGEELDSGGSCPVHGTEPFELRGDNDDR